MIILSFADLFVFQVFLFYRQILRLKKREPGYGVVDTRQKQIEDAPGSWTTQVLTTSQILAA